MTNCELFDTCYFFQNELTGMPCTYKHMINKFCTGDPSLCARFNYAMANGRDSVPLDMFPNDLSEILVFDPIATRRSPAGQVKVIYTDGTTHMIETSRLASLVNLNRIVAYETPERWVEFRRRYADPTYRGPERRKVCSR